MFLSFLIFCPLLFAILVWITPNNKFVRPLALGLSLIEFVCSLQLLKKFDTNSAGLQMSEQFSWIKSFGVTYFVGVDGLSIWLVLLSTFLIPLIILGSWNSISEKVKGFHVNLFILLSAMLGTFLAMDAVLFYIFFEASLIPMYFIVGIWGGQRRIYATVKLVIYTMAGSLLMLVAIIALMVMTGQQLGDTSASVLDFYRLKIPFVGGEFLDHQTLLFFAFSLAFAIKVPLFPVHTWLPDAHVEAPTPGSVVLAAVMLKMGAYGFLRFVIPIFPEATSYWGWLFFLIGTIGIIYGALVAMVQPDIKKLVAYSSVSHMGYVIIGIFALNPQGLTGGLYQMLNHGVSTGALFFLVGMLYERTHSREISKYGGLAAIMPVFTIYFFVITLSSIAVPLTNGFVGEFLILMGTFLKNKVFGSLAVLGVVLGASYMLWMFKRVFFGKPGELSSHGLLDLNLREQLVLVPLVVLVFWMGLFPNHFLRYSQASLQHLATSSHNYMLSVDQRSDLKIHANSHSGLKTDNTEEL